MLDLAQMRYLEGNFTDCFHISTQTLKNAKDKNKEKLLELAALSALQLGIPQSLELCAEVCNLQRDSLFWTLCFAKALLGQNKAQAAMQILESLNINATPLKQEILTLLLQSYKAQNLLEKADSIYKILLQNNPTNWNIWNEFVTMYYNAGAYENSLAVCQNAYTIALQALHQTPPTIPQSLNPNSLDVRISGMTQNMVENPEIAALKE